jgi:hypothetical protein
MTKLGAHLDDAEFAVARDGATLASAPSIVHADPSDLSRFGTPAADTARRTPHLVSLAHWPTLARGAALTRPVQSVLRAELRKRIGAFHQTGDSLHLAVPAALEAPSLGWVLGACRAESLPVAALHDGAAVAVSALGLQGTVVVLEAGLQHFGAVRVVTEGGTARRRAARVTRDTGLMALRQAWMQLVAEAMLLRSRFDPLHDAVSEQRLFDRIMPAAAEAATEGSVTIELPTGGLPCSVTLSRDQFAAAARPAQRALLSSIDGLRPPGAPFTLLVPAALLAVPGLASSLRALPNSRVVLLPSGLIARAVSMLSAEIAAADEGPEILPPLEAASELVAGANDPPHRAPPTHVLWEGQALPLVGALEVGRAPAAGGVRLSDGLAGISRMHCSLRASASGVELVDHSRFGTWLNGRRVAGRASLAAGDRIRVGDPGVELALIAVGADSR